MAPPPSFPVIQFEQKMDNGIYSSRQTPMVQKNYGLATQKTNETPLGTTEKKPPYQTFGERSGYDGSGRKSPAPINMIQQQQNKLEYRVNDGNVPRTDNKGSLNNSKISLLDNN